MSHVVKVQTQYKDQAALVAALEATFGAGVVEVHTVPVAGWMGQHTDSVGNVVVRMANARGAHADIGFLRTSTGEYTAIVDDYDRAPIEPLKQRYAVGLATAKAKAQGYTVKQETVDGGKVRLVLSKWGG